MFMYYDLTEGRIAKNLILFSLPMIAGDLLQQVYNITDTLIVGRFVGAHGLAAVGSAYALMTFLTSIFIGLSIGVGSLLSIYLGRRDEKALKTAIVHAFFLIMGITLFLTLFVYLFLDSILSFLQIPAFIVPSMRIYLLWIFSGMMAVAFYNFFACILRAVGNSLIPLYFLGISAVINIVLDLLFVLVFHAGISGAAIATIIAQYISAIGITFYFVKACPAFMPQKQHFHYNKEILKAIGKFSILTCLQQTCMNFGILLIQRLVDSFGAITMAGYAAAVKIDTFAYLPVQDFGNAFSTFIAQNYGAAKKDRLQKGIKIATIMSSAFSLVLSLLVCLFAKELMMLFVKSSETKVILSGVHYLRIEGACYIGIGCLFLLYGLYRSIDRPEMSLILTIISLGLRVVLAYAFAPLWGETGIWISIPIGWLLADSFGYLYYLSHRSKLLTSSHSQNDPA
jgi:putative MATE family efflux protein